MKYLITALYIEAIPFIQEYQLKQYYNRNGITYFKNTDQSIFLCITGTGKIKSAIATSLFLSSFDIHPDDVLIHFGCSAGLNNEDGLYIANQIYDLDEDRTYYPDLLWDFHLSESNFVTGSKLYDSSKDTLPIGCGLYDMESSAVYQAGIQSFACHQMIFIRFVSDYGNPNITKDMLSQKISYYGKQVFNLIDQIPESNPDLLEDNSALLQEFFHHIHSTVSMNHTMIQYVRYAETIQLDWKSYLQELLKRPVTSKEEGKQLYEEFKSYILS